MSDEYVAARQRLITQLELDEGFWLALVSGVDDRPRERLRRVVRAWCGEHGVSFFEHARPPDELREVAFELTQAREPGVHWIRAEDARHGVEVLDAGFARLLLTMNERRDAYARNLPGPVVIEGRATLRRQLQELAPDLFSIAIAVPELGRDPIEIDPELASGRSWWHVLPDASDPDGWNERALRASAPTDRFIAWTHAAEGWMARREFSRAQPIVREVLALAEQLSQAHALTPALVLLRLRARVWRAVLAVEEGDFDAALELADHAARDFEEAVEPDAARSGVIGAAIDVERANVFWSRGERADALVLWERAVDTLRSLDAGVGEVIDRALVEGGLCVLECGTLVGDPTRAFELWDDVTSVRAVRVFESSGDLSERAWLAFERTLGVLARIDRATLERLTRAIEALAREFETRGKSGLARRALEAIAVAEEARNSAVDDAGRRRSRRGGGYESGHGVLVRAMCGVTMDTRFRFEGAEAASLEYMPLDLRRKLDLAALRLSLAAWQAMSLDDRASLCAQDVTDDASATAFRERVIALARAVGHDVPDAPKAATVWREARAPEVVIERVAALGLGADLARWPSLDEPRRYALYRLADARKQPDKFTSALEEFGLLRATRA
jgi:hypothetical protein